MRSKRGQGLSMSVIVVAAIALLVLVILSVIFIGRMSSWGQSTADCENKGGKCQDSCAANEIPYKDWKCEETSDTCCILNPGA